jgi:O-antigen/teichoic acid export membrane protein
VLARVKGLFRNLAIYGLGDVATSLVSLLLLPVYTRKLSPEEYGIIAMLLTIEAVAKILFRWGVDTAFMRMYFDCADQAARQRLASTIFFFLVAVNGTLLAAGVLGAEWLSFRLFDTAQHALIITLVIANTFVVGFYFIPFQVLRIREESRLFISLVFGRSAGTIVARLLLVVVAQMGVLGVVVADVLVTAVFTLVLTRWYAPLIRPVFSRPVLHDALAFGLPRIPHAVANQVIGIADKYFLNAFGALRDVGLYSIGATFGLGLKLFLSAFEYAWTPFFLGAMKEPDAKEIYSKVSTYVIAVLILLVAGLCAVAPDLIRLMTEQKFHDAAVVTPWIALGVMFQGLYLVGSIGLIITRRTSRYPIATGIAAATSVVSNVFLIPRFGLLGAAWSQTIAYGTLAVVTIAFSWREYPIHYEWSRLLRIAVAGALAFAAASRLVPPLPPVAGLLVRGLVTVGAYTALMFAFRFFHAGELRILREMRERALRRKPVATTPPHAGAVEMAGDIVATAPDPLDGVEGSSPDSPAQRR